MTAKRTPVGGGKYCYAGPNCRLHSATGVLAARKLRDEAADLYAGATTLEEMTRAQAALEKASTAYDATREGQASLQEQIQAAGDPLAQVALRRRLLAAFSYEEEVEQEARDRDRLEEENPELAGLQDSFTLSTAAQARAFEQKHNLGTHSIEDPAAYSPWAGNLSEGVRGAKDAKAKLMPLLKAAQKDGYLPANVKYSVRTEGYNALRISVQGLKDSAIGEKNVDGYIDRDGEHAETRQLLSRLQSLTDSLNFNRSNGMVDHFHSGFYASSTIEGERDRKFRFQEADRKKDVRESNQKAKQAQDAVRAAGYKLSVLLEKASPVNVPATVKGERVYQYDGSSVFVVVDRHNDISGVFNMAGLSLRQKDASLSKTEAMGSFVLNSIDVASHDSHSRRMVGARRVALPRDPAKRFVR